MAKQATVVMSSNEPVHAFFGLSYSSYLVLPRTVLQSMPINWQAKFVQMFEDIRKTIDISKVDIGGEYLVKLRDSDTGRLVKDDLANYERGRRRLPLRAKAKR